MHKKHGSCPKNSIKGTAYPLILFLVLPAPLALVAASFTFHPGLDIAGSWHAFHVMAVHVPATLAAFLGGL